MSDLLQTVEQAVTDSKSMPDLAEFGDPTSSLQPTWNRDRLVAREQSAGVTEGITADGWLYCHPHHCGDNVWLHQRIRWDQPEGAPTC